MPTTKRCILNISWNIDPKSNVSIAGLSIVAESTGFTLQSYDSHSAAKQWMLAVGDVLGVGVTSDGESFEVSISKVAH